MSAKTTLLALLVLLGTSFAWTVGYAPPACQQTYTILGANFTYMAQNQTLCAPWQQLIHAVFTSSGTTTTQTAACSSPDSRYGSSMIYNTNNVAYETMQNAVATYPSQDINLTCSAADRNGYNYQTGVNVTVATSCNITLGNVISSTGCYDSQFYSGSGIAYKSCTNTSRLQIQNITTNGAGSVSVQINGSTLTWQSPVLPINTSIYVSAVTSQVDCYYAAGNSTISTAWSVPTNNVNGILLRAPLSSDQQYMAPTSYMSFSDSSVLQTDGLANANVIAPAGTSFCKLLLYFNSPYYGNIQLVPGITYSPGAFAYPDFYNTTSNVAYIPNNTLTYIFDKVTQTTYIVPAYICSDYNIVGSSSTLAYNPTSQANGNINVTPVYESVFSNFAYQISAIDSNGTVVTNGGTNNSFNISMISASSIGDICSTTFQIIRTVGDGSSSLIYNSTDLSYLGANRSFYINSSTGAAYYTLILQTSALTINLSNSNGFYNLSNNSLCALVSGQAYVTLVPYTSQIGYVRQPLQDAFKNGGGWAWIFVSTVLTMLIVGYASRYILDGAGILGALFFLVLAAICPVDLMVAGHFIPMWAIGSIGLIVALLLVVWRYV